MTMRWEFERTVQKFQLFLMLSERWLQLNEVRGVGL